MDKWDGPHNDFVVKPPLWVMLNLCGTLLDDVEMLWALIRMGMADAQKPDKRDLYCPECRQHWRPQTVDGSVRICELTNACVHEHCWNLHLKKQTMEYLCRGLKKLSSLWLDFVEYKKAKRRASAEGTEGPSRFTRQIRGCEEDQEDLEKKTYDPDKRHPFFHLSLIHI